MSLVEVGREDWSFGEGVAQYAGRRPDRRRLVTRSLPLPAVLLLE